ncbi:MAG: hypothetical protein GXY55_21280 [Phycisphaerae bacterium]|nr:hypothetical protein [Phycisphaerae bacterium]
MAAVAGQILAGVLLVLIAGSLAAWALLRPWRSWRQRQERSLFEHALKHLFTREHGGEDATVDSVGDAVGISLNKRQGLVTRMADAGLLRSAAEGLHLTVEGRQYALHVIRAHRLWERYLADDANVPMGDLHRAAHRAEHRLTPDEVAALDAHLGYPPTDPHGDPIPRATGECAALAGMSLTDWPIDKPACIVHIEDEPEVVFRQILAQGLRPGQSVRVLERTPHRMILTDGVEEYRLAPQAAAQLQVAAPPQGEPLDTHGLVRLSDLPDGREAEVIAIDEQYRGLGRRRLLDFGLTQGARVCPELRGIFRDPRAFRIRGSLVSLRSEQASRVWVRPIDESQQAA